MVMPNHHPMRNSSAQDCYAAMNTRVVKFLALVMIALLSYSWLPQAAQALKESSSDDPYAQPFCDASGQCGETPEIPSPRTVFSAKTHKQYFSWWEAHAALNRSAAEYASRRQQSGIQQHQALILLGDSITESWIGTNMGKPEARTEGVPAVLTDFFKQDFDPLVLAIGGDQTQHLLYRLEHGEILPEFAHDQQAVFVVLIGTNNLGSGELPGPTSVGVMAVADYLLKHTTGKLLLVQLLPRGDRERVARLCPPRCDSHGTPFESFMPAVKKVNAVIHDEAPKLSNQYGANRLSIVDCGSAFLESKQGKKAEVDKGLMPDRLHPNAKGHRLLAKCILDCIGGNC
jgi:lysophospholipase L1-like esterase